MPVSDQLWMQKHTRTFIQFGGTSPANAASFYGIDTDFCAVSDITIPQGSQSPVQVWSPNTINRYLLVGRTSTPPALPSGDIVFYEKLGTVPKILDQSPCDLTAYIGLSNCKDPGDFGNGWNGYITVLPNGHAETVKLSARSTLPSGDGPLEDTITVQWGQPYVIGPLAFGARAASSFATRPTDVVYYSDLQCGQCGVNDDGTQWIAAVLIHAAATADFAYSVDGGATFTVSAMVGTASGEGPVAIDRAGNNLIVLEKTAGGNGAYFYTTFNALSGVPVTTFTKVSGGFVAAKTPNDMWAVSANEIWMVGDGGYIYKLTTVGSAVTVSDAGGATTSALNRIQKQLNGNVIVAVGAAGVVVYSLNSGASWAAATVVGAAVALVGLAVKSAYEWWVIDTNGLVWYTLNQGTTWNASTIPGALATGKDIVFVTDEVGYVVGMNATPIGVLAVTFNGGHDWYGAGTSRYLGALPADITADRLAYPRRGVPGVAANNLIIAGTLTGTTGTLILGSSAKF